MRLSPLLLATLALAKAPKPRKIQHGFRSQSPNTRSLLTLRQSTCDSDQTTCEVEYCMPLDASCCYEGDGSYCDDGDYCVDGGCCELGEDCDGSLTAECADDEEECGWGCMPQGSVCCEEDSTLGLYCDAGETCDGVWCESGSGSGGDDEAEDEDDSPTLCARRRGGGGGGVDVDDECDDAGTTKTPALLACLVAMVPLIL